MKSLLNWSHLRRALAEITFVVAIFGGTVAVALAHGDDGKRSDAGPVLNSAPLERLFGVVDEIVIDNQVDHTTHRYRELRLADGTFVALQGALADAVQPGSTVEITGRRSGVPLAIESVRASPSMPSAPTAGQTGPSIEVAGTLAIAHADDFETGRSEFVYEIHEDNGTRRRLDVASLPQPLRWGMRISVNGRPSFDGSTLRPSRITIIAPGPNDTSSKRFAVPEKAASTVLLIMANFNNTAVPSFTPAQAQQVMTSNATSVANYYSEVSYGQQTFNVTVTNWVTMGIAKPSTCSNSDWQGIGNAAVAAASAANSAWNSANYGFVVYLFPQVAACGWNGLAYVGSPHKAYINGTNSFVTQVIAHEMGHNFGLLHAGSLQCASAPIGGSCAVSEYGDPFDTMGNQRAMHFNAQQKRTLNWISAGTVSTHSGGTIAYSLSPIESPGGTLYAIKISAAANRTYWIEFRQPIGFDSPLSAYPNNGAQIRVASPFETLCSGCTNYSNDTELLDMTPATSTFTDAALLVGQSFSDNTYGVNINVISASASALTVQVTTGGGQAASTTTLTSAPNPSTVGATVTFTATVTGSAPTGSVSFTDGGNPLAGCSAAALGGSGNARTALCNISGLSAGSHSVVATYGGDTVNTGSTSNTVVQAVNNGSSTTGIASSANPSQAGSNVTFTATVAGVAPTGTVSFTDNGTVISGCPNAALAGTGNIRTALCSTSGIAVGTHAMVARYSGDAGNPGSTSPTLSQVVNSASGNSINVALAANGGIASASSTYSGAFPIAAINDADRTGANWGNGGGWNDGTANGFPDWVQINFNGSKTIDRVVVYTLPDNYGAPVEPGDAQAFSLYGIVDFSVQAWNGTTWVTIAIVSGNNLVKRSVTFSAITTDRIRVNVTNALSSYSRIVEIEAWSTSNGLSNVALAANGGVASASSTYGSAYPLAAVNDNDHTGVNWGNGGGWNDATANGFPDWVQINFNGSKTIDRVTVYTLPDNYGIPVEPSDTQAFSLYGTVDFNVQAWNGTTWVTLSGVSGNNLVKRTVTFSAVTTDRIRVNVTNALLSYSRIVEIEAWGF